MTRVLVADIVPASCVDGPGNRYVVFVQGCNFNCLACHNPHTIPKLPTAESRWVEIETLHADIASKAAFLSGVTVSGGEATLQCSEVRDLFSGLDRDPRTARLTRLVDSNGDADPSVWDVLAPSMHGAMIDLKAFDPDVHRELTGRDNRRVLASIRHLASLDRLAEVRLLIVPDVNDGLDQLAATATWLADLDPVPPVIVQGFRRIGTRHVADRFREAGRDELVTATATLVEYGLPHERVTVRAPRDLRDVAVTAR